LRRQSGVIVDQACEAAQLEDSKRARRGRTDPQEARSRSKSVACADDGADGRRIHECHTAQVNDDVGVIEKRSFRDGDAEVHSGGDVVLAS
jgi:hypothetical protein